MSTVHRQQAEPFQRPSIWADNRQALCDALPYYKAHESSLYSAKKIAKGVLVGKQATIRDLLSPEVIITTV